MGKRDDSDRPAVAHTAHPRSRCECQDWPIARISARTCGHLASVDHWWQPLEQEYSAASWFGSRLHTVRTCDENGNERNILLYFKVMYYRRFLFSMTTIIIYSTTRKNVFIIDAFFFLYQQEFLTKIFNIFKKCMFNAQFDLYAVHGTPQYNNVTGKHFWFAIIHHSRRAHT